MFSTSLPKCTHNLVSPMLPMSTTSPSTTLESWLPSFQNTKKLNFKEFQTFIAKIRDFKKFKIFVENKIFFSTVQTYFQSWWKCFIRRFQFLFNIFKNKNYLKSKYFLSIKPVWLEIWSKIDRYSARLLWNVSKTLTWVILEVNWVYYSANDESKYATSVTLVR